MSLSAGQCSPLSTRVGFAASFACRLRSRRERTTLKRLVDQTRKLAGSHLLLFFALLILSILLSGCQDAGPPVATVPPAAKLKSAGAIEDTLPPEIRELPHRKPRHTQMRPSATGDWFSPPVGGVDAVYRDGNEQGYYTILESVGGGVALFDYDRDGDLDLFFPQGGTLGKPDITIRGRPSKLFCNEGNWSFTDVTAFAGLAVADLYTHGAAVGDYDADGFPDLLVTGYSGCHLFHNRQDGTFDDATAASGLVCRTWNTGAVWADFDRDGTLDLFVVTYVDWKPVPGEICKDVSGQRDDCGPNLYAGLPDQLWRGRGDGTFEDVSLSSGVAIPGRGFGASALDVNADGWLDLYVVNDIQENFLFLGGPDLKFQSVAQPWGVAASPEGRDQGSMGLDFGDVNGDGWPDLWYTNFTEEDNSLCQNLKGTSFADVTITTRLSGKSWQWVGFGTVLEDFDHDGWLDIFVANGHVLYHSTKAPYFQPPQLFRGQMGQRFEEISDSGGPYFSVPQAGRGVAVGDLDNDGAADIVVAHQNDPAAVLANQIPAERWVRLQLAGVDSDRTAVAARVTLEMEDRALVRWVRVAGGYLSSCDPRVLFPLPNDSPAVVIVQWPRGRRERFPNLEQRRTHVLREGTGQPL